MEVTLIARKRKTKQRLASHSFTHIKICRFERIKPVILSYILHTHNAHWVALSTEYIKLSAILYMIWESNLSYEWKVRDEQHSP
jgi:hypothetical protein